MIRPEQIRAARALLSLSQSDVARRAEIGLATLQRLESDADGLRGSIKTLDKVRKALEAAGVMFVDQDETAGLGVRLRKSGATK